MCFADVPGVRLLRILAACRGPVFLASETPRRIRKHASPSPRSRRGALLPTRTQMIGALGRNATVRIILLTLIGAPLITGSSGARAETPSRRRAECAHHPQYSVPASRRCDLRLYGRDGYRSPC